MKVLIIITVAFYLYNKYMERQEAKRKEADRKRFKKMYRISI